MISMQGFLTADRVAFDPATHDRDVSFIIPLLRLIDQDAVSLSKPVLGSHDRPSWSSMFLDELLALDLASWRPIATWVRDGIYWQRVEFLDSRGDVVAFAFINEEPTWSRRHLHHILDGDR